ncbi:MAG TPA: hypothetical protein VNK05_19010, partial [Chloroflexota bacterium]|nr:hypothetical protein [Chloroflexota bacterium]
MTPAQSATIAEPAAPATGGQGAAPPEKRRAEGAAPAPRLWHGLRSVLGVRLLRRRPAGPGWSGAPRWARIRPKGSWLLTAAELGVLALWAIWFARPYLNLDPQVVPSGREYGSTINLHHLWTRAAACGWCALWNGTARGGSPALVDPYGSTLHPLVAATTLGWGVTAGAKLSLAGAFFIGGLAQWWLGRVLGLGRLACLWGGAVAVVAGNLAGRMELGAFALVLSTASCALVLPPLVGVARTGTRRMAVLLGVVMALAALSGQAYVQIGLVCALPALVVLLPGDGARRRLILRRYALAALVAVLLAAPLLVPLGHFLPQLGKETDPLFRSAQPFQYLPLNLVVGDYAFYTSPLLGKQPYPAVYVNYVGWLPVALAVFALACRLPSGRRRAAWFLAAFGLLTLWLASAAPFIWLSRMAPDSWLSGQFTGIRYPTLIAGLAVPCVLGLAAIGVDRLLGEARLRVAVPLPNAPGAAPRRAGVDLRWLVAAGLVLAVYDAWHFNRQWVRTERLPAEVQPVLDALRTPDSQWVDVAFGEHYWMERATGMGLKLGIGFQRFSWKNRPPPDAVREASRSGPPPGASLRQRIGGVSVYDAQPGGEYAAVVGAGAG